MLRSSILLAFGSLLAYSQTFHIVSPHDGAKLHSSYVTIEGEAKPGARVDLLEGGAAITVIADSAGKFERVVRFTAGHHRILIRSGLGESIVEIEISSYSAPSSPAPYERMQTADIILVHSRNSPLDALYEPVYTHAALYIGPDAEGVPRLLEAVGEPTGPEGPVAAVPIEETLAWQNADRVDVFRLQGGLKPHDRTRIVDWSMRTAARGVPFAATEFGDVYRAWLLWDPRRDRPRQPAEFERLITALRGRLHTADAYDCATLVWHAYLDNTEDRIDLANPNRIRWGGAMKNVSERFTTLLIPVAILPDSFALSGKLTKVTIP